MRCQGHFFAKPRTFCGFVIFYLTKPWTFCGFVILFLTKPRTNCGFVIFLWRSQRFLWLRHFLYDEFLNVPSGLPYTGTNFSVALFGLQNRQIRWQIPTRSTDDLDTIQQKTKKNLLSKWSLLLLFSSFLNQIKYVCKSV